MGDTGVHVVRWRRYGKDRLYVNDSEGRRLGWVDVLTGEVTVDIPEQRAAVEAAAAEASIAQPAFHDETTARVEAPEPAAEPPAVVAAPTPEPAWRDLSLNRPGQMAREQAEAELAAMRDRSRIGTFVARTLDWKTEERAWRVGAGGEGTVGAKLEKLGEHGWHVLHAVPVGSRGSDIDHVLIGPGGVYTINTKTHPGKKIWVSPVQIRVNGQPKHYLQNSRHEAERAERLLSAAVGFRVPVKPVLVFLTGTFIPDVTIKQRPDDVVILDRLDIPRAFKRAPMRLHTDQVEMVFSQARRSTTWI